MGYQVQYELRSIKVVKNHIKKNRIRYFLMVVALVLGAIGVHFGGTILEIIMLGQGQAVITASEQMIEDIREGISLPDAVQTFYLEIVE